MALVLADRVLETTAVTGTGNAALGGAQANYQTFSVIGDGSTTYYTIVDNTNNEWEVGIGTYVAIGNYISRDTVLSSSNAGSLVYFGSGTKDIFCDLPAEKVATLGALSYQGTWNASTNVPTLASGVGTQGYYYVVSVAGSTNLDGITDWKVNDYAIYNGTAWQKIDNTDAVTSVNGLTGTVVLTTTNIAEGTNEYFTTAKARASVSAGTGISYDSGTGVITNTFPSLGGDVVGPASATDNAVARFDTTTGKLIQNSVVTISDTGAVAGATNITDINYVDFNTAYGTTLGVGQLGWDGNDTLAIGMAGGNVIQHIGEDLYFYCKATSAITKGQVVMFTGAVGASGVPTGAPATGITDGTYIMGVAAEDIALNGFGLVQSFGELRNVNTSSYADGDILWYNPAVAGGLTKTKPVAPNVKVQMAAVINGGSVGGGTILIRIDAGSTLGGTDSNAEIVSPTGAQLLTYDQTSAYWKNTNLAAGTGISVNNATNGVITVTNSAPDQTVAITGAGGAVVTGTYPNFTITTPSGTVTSVTGTAPVVSSGGATPAISMAAANTTTNGYLTSTDWNTFNGKGAGTVTSVTGTAPISVATGTSTPVVSLDNTAVSPGSYTYASITVDAKGRLTAASNGASPSAFPSGTAMLFVQTSAPTGWTKSTTHDNKALRIVSGTASSGGSVAFTTAFASQAVSGSVAATSSTTATNQSTTAGGSISVTVDAGTLAVGAGTFAVGATTLSSTQIPGHTHTVNCGNTSGANPIFGYSTGYSANLATQTGSTGGGSSHTHGLTGSPSISGSPSVTSSSFTGTSHNHTQDAHSHTSGAFTGTAINLAVSYVDAIIATKD